MLIKQKLLVQLLTKLIFILLATNSQNLENDLEPKEKEALINKIVSIKKIVEKYVEECKNDLILNSFREEVNKFILIPSGIDGWIIKDNNGAKADIGAVMLYVNPNSIPVSFKEKIEVNKYILLILDN